MARNGSNARRQDRDEQRQRANDARTTSVDQNAKYVDGAAASEHVGSAALRDSPMMAHLLDALQEGTDIGHYGRLVFAMIARHFMGEDELIELLAAQPGMDEREARSLVLQVQGRDYNPPKRDRILEWQSQQEFPICPTPDDPQSCNVYRELRFPSEIYESIGEYWEERAEAQEDEA